MCRLAGLNWAFRGASLADFVWESKLPSSYQALIEKVFDGFPDGLRRTDVYAMLCRVNSIDGGSKESDLHPRTGHTEFIDKTLEAANPISLEAPKQDFACSFQIPNSGSILFLL